MLDILGSQNRVAGADFQSIFIPSSLRILLVYYGMLVKTVSLKSIILCILYSSHFFLDEHFDLYFFDIHQV